MHLISHGLKISLKPFYLKRSLLTRPDSLASIFRKLRQNNNLTKGAIAAKFGVSEDYISALESGSKFPSLRYCLFCAQEFGANPYWVKNKWAKEVKERFSAKLDRKLGLDLNGGSP